MINLKNTFHKDFKKILLESNIEVDPVGLSGGLALFWKTTYDVEILSTSNRIIDTKVKIGSLSFFMTFVYGDPVCNRRHLVWNTLKVLGENRTGGWFLIGDFNAIMNNDEKSGGTIRPESTFYPFRSMARECRLKELPSSGDSMSWAGTREIMVNGIKEQAWIQCRLDRAFGNAEWFRLFPRRYSTYLEKTGSDHRHVLTSLAACSQQRTGRFCFDKRWCTKPEVIEIVRQGWNRTTTGIGGLVMNRIRNCRKELSKWKLTADCNTKKRILQLRKELEEEVAKRRPDTVKMLELKLNSEQAYKEEETYWKERSKNSWLKGGDKNTKVFHGWAQGRKMKNRVAMLTDDNDVEHFAEDEKGDIVVQYFTKLFRTSSPSNASELLDGFNVVVTDTMNQALTKLVSDAEIRRAVKAVKSTARLELMV